MEDSNCSALLGPLGLIFHFMICQMLSVGERSRLKFSTQTLLQPCCCNTCSMWISIVLLLMHSVPLKKNIITIVIYCTLKLVINLSGLMVLFQMCKLVIPQALMHHYSIKDRGRVLIINQMVPLLFSLEDCIYYLPILYYIIFNILMQTRN